MLTLWGQYWESYLHTAIIYQFTVFSSHSDKTRCNLFLRLTDTFILFSGLPRCQLEILFEENDLWISDYFSCDPLCFILNLKCLVVNYLEYCRSLFDTAKLQASATFRLIWRGYFSCSREMGESTVHISPILFCVLPILFFNYIQLGLVFSENACIVYKAKTGAQ